MHLLAATLSAGDADDVEDDDTRLARYIDDARGSVGSHDSDRWSATDNEDTWMDEILSNQEARKNSEQSYAAVEVEAGAEADAAPSVNGPEADAKRKMNQFFLNASTIIGEISKVRDTAS